eukprot:GEMP01041187.1.p1 GENE.GEMP01041187.1~~GEMP01041187.1.p1  ORF type:complete len:394 (+),score=57.26 GEMP01041187.1:92-1273(+)
MCRAQQYAVFGYLLILATGVSLTVFAASAMQSHSYDLASRLVEECTSGSVLPQIHRCAPIPDPHNGPGGGDLTIFMKPDTLNKIQKQNGPKIGVHRWRTTFDMGASARFTLVLGILSMVAAVIGFIGACGKSQAISSAFIYLAMALCLVSFTFGVSALIAVDTLRPELGKQIPYSCGPSCQERIEWVRQAGGCSTLTDICTQASYHEISGYCLLADGAKPQAMENLLSMSAAACRSLCDNDRKCTGFTMRTPNGTSSCSLITTTKPGSSWLPQRGSRDVGPLLKSKNADDVACYRKGEPRVLDLFEEYTVIGGLAAVTHSAILLFAAAATAAYLWQLHTRHRGRKGLLGVCYVMFCPCCRERAPEHAELSLLDSGMEPYRGSYRQVELDEYIE